MLSSEAGTSWEASRSSTTGALGDGRLSREQVVPRAADEMVEALRPRVHHARLLQDGELVGGPSAAIPPPRAASCQRAREMSGNPAHAR